MKQLDNKRQIIVCAILILSIMLLISAGCTPAGDPTLEPESEQALSPATPQTSNNQPALRITPIRTTVPETVAPPGGGPTPSPTMTGPVTADPPMITYRNGYLFVVNYAVPFPGNEGSGLPQGKQWVVVVATLNNLSGQPLAVALESVTLIDTEGNRYHPDPPDKQTAPPLAGAQLDQGDSLRGLARFTLPIDTTAAYVELCPQQIHPCPQPLRSRIP